MQPRRGLRTTPAISLKSGQSSSHVLSATIVIPIFYRDKIFNMSEIHTIAVSQIRVMTGPHTTQTNS